MDAETIFFWSCYLLALLLCGAAIVLIFGEVPTKYPVQEGLKIKGIHLKRGGKKKSSSNKTSEAEATTTAAAAPDVPPPPSPETTTPPSTTTTTDTSSTITPEEANAPIVLSDKLKGNYESNIEAAQAVKRQLMGMEKITLKIVGNEIKNMVADMDDKEKELDKYLM
jgi:hypothetical protein